MATVNPNDEPEQQRADIGPAGQDAPRDVAEFAEAQTVQHLHQSPPEDPHAVTDTVVKVEGEGDTKPDKPPAIGLKDEPTPNELGPTAVTDVSEPDKPEANPVLEGDKPKAKGK